MCTDWINAIWHEVWQELCQDSLRAIPRSFAFALSVSGRTAPLQDGHSTLRTTGPKRMLVLWPRCVFRRPGILRLVAVKKPRFTRRWRSKVGDGNAATWPLACLFPWQFSAQLGFLPLIMSFSNFRLGSQEELVNAKHLDATLDVIQSMRYAGSDKKPWLDDHGRVVWSPTRSTTVARSFLWRSSQPRSNVGSSSAVFSHAAQHLSRSADSQPDF